MGTNHREATLSDDLDETVEDLEPDQHEAGCPVCGGAWRDPTNAEGKLWCEDCGYGLETDPHEIDCPVCGGTWRYVAEEQGDAVRIRAGKLWCEDCGYAWDWDD